MPYHENHLLGSCNYSPCSQQHGFAREAECMPLKHASSSLKKKSRFTECNMRQTTSKFPWIFFCRRTGGLCSLVMYIIIIFGICWFCCIAAECPIVVVYDFSKIWWIKVPVLILVVLPCNMAEEIMLYDCSCCSQGNLEQWSLRTELQRQLEWYGKGQWKVPGDWWAPWWGARGQGGHDKKLKQWGSERRQEIGAETPSVVPLRTFLREISLQVLKGGEILFFFFFCVCKHFISCKTFKVLYVSSCTLKKMCIKYWYKVK